MNLELLSLGAGVQSTTLGLMSADGTLGRVDGAIFADTGWEPQHVYEHLDRLAEVLRAAGIPLYKVSKGNLRADSLDPEHRYASVPYFVRNPDGSEGMGRRQCTSEYKLGPINRKVRELLGAAAPDYRRVPKGNHAQQWIGFSTDEVGRVSDKDGVSYITKRYPLLELGMSRDDCERWLRARGWTSVAKSACIGCPYHGNRQWRGLRDTCTCLHRRNEHYDRFGNSGTDHGIGRCSLCGCDAFDAPEWDDAVAFDEAIRKGGARGLPLNGEAFLHRSRVPLSIAPIDRVTSREWHDRQTDVFSQLADLAEEGDPDGCSPYACRSGVAEARAEASR